MTGPEAAEAEPVSARYCVNHPTVETVVACGRCDAPLCPRCMIFAPVGVRCRSCAQLRRLPQFVLTPRVYARVIPGAVGLALAVGFLLSLFPALGWLSGIVVGFLVGEGLRRVSGYKQGREMEIIAGATVVLSVVAQNVFLVARTLGPHQLGQAVQIAIAPQTMGLNALGLIIGVFIAVQRLR